MFREFAISMMVVFIGIPLLLTLLAGVSTWRAYHQEPFGAVAALFALKPLVATPIFLWLTMGGLQYDLLEQIGFPFPGPDAPYFRAYFFLSHLTGLLPGTILTTLLLAYGHRALRYHPRESLLLVGGDVLRWLALSVATGVFTFFVPIWTACFGWICWTLARRSCLPERVLHPL